ncbi:MAG: ribosome biogenesis GTPase Der [Mariprofundales bacterium]|nr:ribosome biogenesis GTPase Der [Mariprofundales bacterium]
MLPVVAIVGRPNVGKSTLFNRLMGQRKAIVGDRPGVTVDRLEQSCQLTPSCRMLLVDTGGIGEGEHHLEHRQGSRPEQQVSMQLAIESQVTAALEVADLVLFVVEGSAGVCAADHDIANRLRQSKHRLMVLVNKAERLGSEMEFHALGLGEPQAVSAMHGNGINALKRRIEAELVALQQANAPLTENDHLRGHPLASVAVIGRPNVGKSTLINRWLREDRMVVSPMAGTTRDAVDHDLVWEDGFIRLVDTAGQRKAGRIKDVIEFVARVKAEQACERADVAVLLLDGAETIVEQDMRLMQMAYDKGCALIVAVNKVDLLDKEEWKHFADRLDFRMRSQHAIPRCRISAEANEGCRKLLRQAVVAAEYNRFQAGTGELNRWLERTQQQQHAPSDRGTVVRIKYITQVSTRPPTLKLFCNRPDTVKESYRRFLEQSFRDTFHLPGVPVRLILTASDNPYSQRKRQYQR